MTTKKITIQSVNPFSVAKIGAVVFPLCGTIGLMVLYINFLIAYMTMIYPQAPDGAGTGPEQILRPWTEVNIVGLLLGLILLALAGFFASYVGSLVYNWMSKLTGGVKVVIKE